MWRKYTAYFETIWKRSYHHCFLYVSRYAELHTHTHTSLYLIGIKALILPKGDVAVIPSSNTDSCDWIMRVLTVEALLFTFVIIVVSLLKLLCPALCFLLSYSHWFLFCFVLFLCVLHWWSRRQEQQRVYYDLGSPLVKILLPVTGRALLIASAHSLAPWKKIL